MDGKNRGNKNMDKLWKTYKMQVYQAFCELWIPGRLINIIMNLDKL